MEQNNNTHSCFPKYDNKMKLKESEKSENQLFYTWQVW